MQGKPRLASKVQHPLSESDLASVFKRIPKEVSRMDEIVNQKRQKIPTLVFEIEDLLGLDEGAHEAKTSALGFKNGLN
jgi:hypothetical protein